MAAISSTNHSSVKLDLKKIYLKLEMWPVNAHRFGVTISNTRATFAYHSFYDNLRLHVSLSTF